jgi:hypothetical protein
VLAESFGLYDQLKSWAIQENPDNLEQAFRALCRLARIYADPDTMQFKLWASDFRRKG